MPEQSPDPAWAQELYLNTDSGRAGCWHAWRAITAWCRTFIPANILMYWYIWGTGLHRHVIIWTNQGLGDSALWFIRNYFLNLSQSNKRIRLFLSVKPYFESSTSHFSFKVILQLLNIPTSIKGGKLVKYEERFILQYKSEGRRSELRIDYCWELLMD